MEQAATAAAPAGAGTQLPRIALVGVHGFGAHHLSNLDRLEAAGALRLVAVADPNPPEAGRLANDVKVFHDLDELLGANVRPDVVIIATPIQTHAPLGLTALAAGADVYLEKPTAASLAQFEELRVAAVQAGRNVQIGFQSLGSLALPALAVAIGSGSLGTIRGISATGMWLRDKAYYQRSRWAGKRTLNGVDVVDGVTTNPLAHAVATALHIAGIHSADAIATVETDLYRAHDIEGDDTSAVRITPKEGPAVVCALTVCAPEQSEPFVTVHGTAGKAVFYYTTDVLEITTDAGSTRDTHARTDLLENLLAHRRNGSPLLSSLENSGAFMRVLEAVRTAGDPQPIAAEHVEWIGEGPAAHPVLADIGAWIERATAAQATFSELGAPWARRAPATDRLVVSGIEVAREISGGKTAPTLSPRPYLHPVTTLGGATVSDAMPLDHVWHLGVGVALQDVNGVNFWGGRTYGREEAGYVWRPDHGHIERTSSEDGPGYRVQELAWLGPDGAEMLHEHRTWAWHASGPGAWQLTLSFTLTPAGSDPVSLGSPGSNGREAGGYGGFFWRLPPVENAHIRTGSAAGEEAVHGSRSPWLAWSGDFAGKPATVVFEAPPEADDPWFVRSAGYPGVGSSLAWDTAVILQPGESLTRTIAVTIADGIATDHQINEWTRAK
ncbi:oxidoreductase [Arthrobacter livingstonensis]|uniref:Oxidoreductase n=1 Tax=Arthrobacter livingstonensis TaxID=670078 RepID=A0A2V5L8Y8_9MICC|nr:oxidoreductase [Arthrobacter livingstonensis]